MCSLPICSPSSAAENSSSHLGASTNISQATSCQGSRPPNKKLLSLDMNKVAQVDDTFVVLETADFEEDCRSADSFKERILNTNLIINKQKRTSFGAGSSR